MEIEINSADAGEVQAQLAQLYASLNNGIDAQIAAATQTVVAQSQPPQPRNGVTSTNRVAAIANGNGRREVHATETQCSAGRASNVRIANDVWDAECIHSLHSSQ